MTDFVRSPATGPFHAEIAEWVPGIYQWQTDDVILGGPDGNDNWPIAALTNRTLWLRHKVEAAETGLDSLLAALAAHAAGRDHPAATTTQIGFVELATVAESVTGTDTVRAVTPAGLAAALATIPAVPAASDTVAGRVELATVDEATTGTDTVRAVTPAGLAAAVAMRAAADISFLAGWAYDGVGEDLRVQAYGSVKLARAVTIEGEVGYAGLAPTGAAVIMDVERDGVSIYTVKPQIAAGATALTAGTLDPARVACPAGTVLTLRCIQVGSVIRGQQVSFTLKARMS